MNQIVAANTAIMFHSMATMGMHQGKKSTKASFRPDNDVAELLANAIEATGEDKTKLFNEALRVGLVPAVKAILEEQTKNLKKRQEAARQLAKPNKTAPPRTQ